MMKKLIAIDNGHGKYTAGKRTPMFPGTNNFIHEWEFNHPTAKKLGELLKQNGFVVLYTSDTQKDTSLSERTKLANEWDASLFVSIHYNAMAPKWGNHGGIETYHYANSKGGKKLADLVHKNLIKDTKLRDRGVKTANFHVLRETNMPSILCECGFMDNLVEAELMQDDEYQMKCARAIAKGICEYFNVTYKEDKKEEVKKDKLYKVQVGAYSIKNNAATLLKDLKKKGFDGFIVESDLKIDIKPISKVEDWFDGDTHIIKTKADNVEPRLIGDTLQGANMYGVNLQFFPMGKEYDVSDPKNIWGIVTNEGKSLGGNSMVVNYKGDKRGTIIYFEDGTLGFKKVNSINEYWKPHIYSFSGFTILPYMDFKGEGMGPGINYKTKHTFVGYDDEGYIYMIVKPNCFAQDIVPLAKKLKLSRLLKVDGGGSSQSRTPTNSIKSTRKVSTVLAIKEV